MDQCLKLVIHKSSEAVLSRPIPSCFFSGASSLWEAAGVWVVFYGMFIHTFQKSCDIGGAIMVAGYFPWIFQSLNEELFGTPEFPESSIHLRGAVVVPIETKDD